MQYLGYLLPVLVFATDFIAIRHLLRWSGFSTVKKIVMAALMLILPIIGVSIYYLAITLSQRKHSVKYM